MKIILEQTILKKINVFLFHFPLTINPRFFVKAIVFVCFINILLIRHDIYELYGEYGFAKSNLSNENAIKYAFTLIIFTNILAKFNISEFYGVYIYIGIYIASLIFLFINYKALFFAILAYLGQMGLNNSNVFATHGGDAIIAFILFLNIIFCLEKVLNVKTFKALYSFTLRFAQIHLCTIYFFSGFGKILGTDWFNGNAIWLVLNIYSNGNALYAKDFDIFYLISGIAIILLELLYPFLVFLGYKIRFLALFLIILMHVFIGIFMSLYSFALIMIFFNFIAWSSYYSKSWLLKRLNTSLGI